MKSMYLLSCDSINSGNIDMTNSLTKHNIRQVDRHNLTHCFEGKSNIGNFVY